TADHVVDYLQRYEERYELPMHRSVSVTSVRRENDRWIVDTDAGSLNASVGISATGTWQSPYLPYFPGQDTFTGRQLHTVDYDSPDMVAGRRVVVVGGGDSAAQILAEVSTGAGTLGVRRRRPLFMPDGVDGGVLSDVATAREAARRSGRDHDRVAGVGDIVMVPPLQAARDHGGLDRSPMFDRPSPTGVS